jgi:copper chaperone
MATTATFTVQGMTCQHCVGSVRDEVSAIAGVQGVEVDLATGRVEITAERPVDPAAVRSAVEEAGYEVVP